MPRHVANPCGARAHWSLVPGGTSQISHPRCWSSMTGPQASAASFGLFDTIAAPMPGARAVLRHITDVGGSATYDDVQTHFAGHPDTPIPKNRIGGTLNSFGAVRRRIGPDDNTRLLELDGRVRVYRIEPALIGGLLRAFALADARPGLMLQDPTGA
ncbi:hypothetical protein KBP30_39730 [Streptomyces sp. Go40/10]|uniref:hypothetical protein n=1 Tax=Streptomyces sp. Go40/10 TaxID=2825844 RepID=UPI001E60A729|nr:hypothetical protein [Streptomyces sp. Go40/10]UFR06929.1 hypothetical protein KBP30_39730 [Streptomyces sp. Go40/10]